jgi:colanic acid/amylovoran biosynthesis glycosyltransferase
MAYLVSQYPMLSMIFILREVVQLRALGFAIDVISINRADRSREGLTSAEAAEADQTYVLKQQGAAGAAKAHLQTLLTHPRGYLRGAACVLQLGGLDLKRLAYNLVYFTEALMAGQWMHTRGLEHVHVHLGSQAATVGLYIKRVFGYGLSITVHGPDEFYDAKGQYLAEKVAAADFLCCISFYARSQLMKLSPYSHWNKLEISRLGVDPQVFVPALERPAHNVFEVLCIGRLTPAKGQHLLIDAADLLTAQGRNVRLRIVGHGQDEASLRAQAARLKNPASVVFEGAVNQDHIRALYAQADAFCIPSFAEGIPVVLMEAMAMGLPCVTTQINGIPELIENGVSGLMVAPSDLHGLVAALARLMDDRELRARLAAAGRHQIEQQYDLVRNVEKLAQIFAKRIGP